MVKRAGVVAEDIAITDTNDAAFSNDDAAGFERSDGLLDRFGAGLDTEVGARGAERIQYGISSRREFPPSNRRTHRVGDHGRRQNFVEPADRRHGHS